MEKFRPECKRADLSEKAAICMVCCGAVYYDMAQDYAYGTTVQKERCGCCGGTGKDKDTQVVYCKSCGWQPEKESS